MSQLFYFDKALKALQSGQTLTGKDGILIPLIKHLTEAVLSAELESHLAHIDPDKRHSGMVHLNRGNFRYQLIKTGSVEVSV